MNAPDHRGPGAVAGLKKRLDEKPRCPDCGEAPWVTQTLAYLATHRCPNGHEWVRDAPRPR